MAAVGTRSSSVRGKQWGNKGGCAGRKARRAGICHPLLVQLSPTVSGEQGRLGVVVQFTLLPQEGRRSKAVATTVRGAPMSEWKTDGGKQSGDGRNSRIKGIFFLPVVGWWGQVRRRRRARCRQPQMKGRLSPATHHCGAALETDSHCCCPPQTHKSPPA